MAYIERVVYLSEEKYNELVLSGKVSDTELYIVPNAMFPVGYVYISTVDKSPALLFGGTWEKIEGKFLLSASSAYTAGSVGGSADAVVVSHHHTGLYYNDISADRKLSADTANGQEVTSGGHIIRTSNVQGTNNYVTGEVGEDGTGKNMPPYLAVYMWKRIA